MKPRSLLFALRGLIAVIMAASFSPSLLHAAETLRSTPPPVVPVRSSSYDLEIVNGDLALANLKDRINIAKWGAVKVEASLHNIVDVLRELHPDVNITMSPSIEKLVIGNLKLRSSGLPNELDALTIASGSRFTWSQRNSGGDANTAPIPLFVLVPNGRPGEGGRGVEVFNLGAYFQQLGERDKKETDDNLKKIQDIILTTLGGMDILDNEDRPTFQFHPGANLLVVTGGPRSLEVAHKVIGALQAQAAGPGGFALNDFGMPGGVGGGGGFGDAANPFGGMSKGRRQILDKLQGIRLESVRYEQLPLREIVRNLAEESKKRDPEKRGLNFMVHTTPSPSQPVGAINPTTGVPLPQELIDVNAIMITIDPALNNVRILDVLDAMVRSADHPIRYSITDYAVVFSLKDGEDSTTRPRYRGVPADGGR